MKPIMELKFYILSIALILSSCKAKQEANVISGYYNYDTECVNSYNDGSVLVKAWGKGTDQRSAENNARKNAVDDLLFKGISNGNSCNIRPIISNPNTKRDQQDFFESFYSNGGDYNNFISDANTKLIKQKELRVGEKAFEIMVNVDVRSLKEYFKDKFNN